MPSKRIRRLQSLATCLLMGSGSSFRFGGGLNPRFGLESLGGLFRVPDPTVVSKKPGSSEPAAAATKGIGSDGETNGEKTSNGPRRIGGTVKPRDMPTRFPLRRLPIVGDDTISSDTDGVDSDAVSSSDFDIEYEDDDEKTTGNHDDHHDDEPILSMVNGMVSDIESLDSQQVSGKIEVGDEEDASGRGKRVTFFASKESTKVLSLDDKYTKLLDDYMTLPLEQYSVKSFHDGESDNVEGRRWFLRRLDEEESLQYLQDYEPRDNHENFIQDGPSDTDKASLQEDERGRCFRLAVPLKPIIGVELTPVIDLEVIPALKPQQNPELIGEDDQEERQGISNPAPEQRTRRRPLRAMRRAFRRRRTYGGRSIDYDENADPAAVRVQSLRVSLLSAEDEVKSLMKKREEKIPKPNANPTQVSQNPSVQQIGTEAIGVVGKIEQAITPHITFDAIITWDSGSTAEARSDDSGRRNKKGKKRGPSVTVRSTAVTSLTIPPIPTAFRVPLPLPLGVLVRRIGTLLTKRALDITLPRFLRQLERDLERWAKGDGGNER